MNELLFAASATSNNNRHGQCFSASVVVIEYAEQVLKNNTFQSELNICTEGSITREVYSILNCYQGQSCLGLEFFMQKCSLRCVQSHLGKKSYLLLSFYYIFNPNVWATHSIYWLTRVRAQHWFPQSNNSSEKAKGFVCWPSGTGSSQPTVPEILASFASPSKLGGQKTWGDYNFYFRWATVFCLGYRLSKHKMTRCAKNFGRSWPPGYA